MQRLRDFFAEKVWIIAWILIALLSLTAKVARGQGKLPPIVVPAGSAKINASLPELAEYAQPPIYELWWLEIGSCQGLIVPQDLTRNVHFVYVNSPSMIVDLEPGVYGFADAPHRTIYLPLTQIYNKPVVLHEMQHLLNYWNGIDEGRDYHSPRSKWERCGITKYYIGN